MQLKTHRLYELELLFTLLSVLLAFIAPRISLRLFSMLLQPLRRLARHPRSSALLVAAVPLVLRFALLPWIPVPQPQIQEEFSYLLQADTFAHGRLANPPHPMAVFFDNVQLIQVPRYASARLPGQSLFLWLGQILFGMPWAGVCLSVAAMCAAFYWMLRAWTRPPWALLVALIFAIRFGVVTYWMNSYWGGAVIALGGALVLGALPRLLSRQRLRDALLYALGCCLLASTRPYEGFAFVLPTAILLLGWSIRSPEKGAFRLRVVRTLLPIASLLAAFFAWFAYFNFVNTGHLDLTAYQVWRNQQSIVPTFWWQPLRRAALTYYSRQTREFNTVWEVGIYHALRHNLHSLLSGLAWRPVEFLQLYVRPLLLLPLLAPLLFLRKTTPPRRDTPRNGGSKKGSNQGSNKERTALGDGLFVLVGMLALLLGHSLPVTLLFFAWSAFLLSKRGVEPRLRIPLLLLLAGALSAVLTTFSMPTYYAAFTAPAFVLVAVGMRVLALWRRRQGTGRAIVANLSLACCLMLLVYAALSVLHVHILHESPFNWTSYENGLQQRVEVERFLDRQPGKQLAIVRYGPEHDVLDEWVWNLAAIDRQKIVWARELKPEWNAQLVQYYRGRKVWLIEPDTGVVEPYPVGTLPPASAEQHALPFTEK